MSDTPIYDELREREVLGENYDCPACSLMYQGWVGRGCCEICDMTRTDHTCKEPML